MAPSTKERTQRILQSTKSAASILAQIAQLSQTPFLATTASITTSILESLQTFKTPTQELVQMTEQIHDILCGIITLQITSDPTHTLSQAVLHDIGFFAETLNKIQIWINNQERTSKIRRLFRQNEEVAQLEVCKAGIKIALDVFGAQSSVTVLSAIEALRQDTQAQHDDFLDLLEAADTDSSYSRRSTLFNLGTSSSSLSLLPASPKIFHGREAEVCNLIEMLLDGFPRIAILGPGGMGKTCLATAALHDPKVVDKYQTRYFVSCDSAHTKDSLVAIIASNLGLETSRGLAKAVIQQLSTGPPCLITLDNFETPWEPVESRAAVEEFLSLLTDIPHVALLVTMRGAERPGKIPWTRPFLRPLTPLTQVAARQTFVDIADEIHDDTEVDELLGLTDYVPLAVQLVATIAASEGCETTLKRWKYERTALLSDGFDKRSNLEISIQLSLSSPRMLSSPHAEELLGLMSLLSDGVFDVDLIQSKLPIPDILKCKTTLVRTSLVYLDHTGRIKVLAPIREYLHTARPPTPQLVRPLRKHFNGLLKLWSAFMHRESFVADLIPRLISNLGNVHNVLLHGLDSDDMDLGETMRGVILLSQFNRVMGRGLSPLLLRLPDMLVGMGGDRELHAQFITEEFQAWQFHKVPDPEKTIDEALEHFHVLQDLEMEARFHNVIAEYYLDRIGDLSKAKIFFDRALSLASQCNDEVAQVRALGGLALLAWFSGNYQEGRRLAWETHKISVASGNINGQRNGLRIQAMCCTSLGDFTRTVQLVAEGKELVLRTGMQGGEFENMLMNTEADVHQLKTEYAAARAIQEVILRQTSLALAPVTHAHALANVAFLDIVTGAPRTAVSRTLDAAAATFRSAGYPRGIAACDVFRADLLLREGGAPDARAEYVRLFAALRSDDELACYCLAKLADPTCTVHGDAEAARWAAVFLAFTIRAPARNQLALHQALRCLGDVLAQQGEDDAARSVLAVALDGFTRMDVHQSRAECMRTMGDVCLRRRDLAKARELWVEARPLFERAQQTREVAGIDERLQSLGAGLKLHAVPTLKLPVLQALSQNSEGNSLV
ncbi:AAA domain-containing protein [Mycena venus]|uniref:AAA domain-containing protein n=1 Tax=Mycena venus TaxID=2733690 RepID=A0A8H7CGY0_9AGAR|nr:AAA domain-containing protein [Mycena venus]